MTYQCVSPHEIATKEVLIHQPNGHAVRAPVTVFAVVTLVLSIHLSVCCFAQAMAPVCNFLNLTSVPVGEPEKNNVFS